MFLEFRTYNGNTSFQYNDINVSAFFFGFKLKTSSVFIVFVTSDNVSINYFIDHYTKCYIGVNIPNGYNIVVTNCLYLN